MGSSGEEGMILRRVMFVCGATGRWQMGEGYGRWLTTHYSAESFWRDLTPCSIRHLFADSVYGPCGSKWVTPAVVARTF